MPAVSTPGSWIDSSDGGPRLARSGRELFGSPLYPIVDAGVFGDGDPGPVLAELARAGVRIAQLRAKGMPAGAFLAWVRAGILGAAATGLKVIANDRADVALLAGAAGVHLGQADLSCRRARALLGDDAIIGLSTHTAEQVQEARSAGADYLAIGPVFPTETKPDAAPVVGVSGVRSARRSWAGPLVAIGGITAPLLVGVLEADADAVAVASALSARSPAGVGSAAVALLAAAGERPRSEG